MTKTNLSTLRHSLAHIMADAVLQLYPQTKFAIGPDIENGFYYDFEFEDKLTPNDLKKIEKRMKKMLQQKFDFEQKNISIKEAQKLFSDQSYKLELIKDLADDGNKEVSIYTSHKFQDLCKGPHVESSSELKKMAFNLHKIAGAYWKGSEKNQMLTRIYALAFEAKDELENYLTLLAEAEKRDHRKLGKELDLFSFHTEAPGMAFWHDKGITVWNELLALWRELHTKAGYQETRTPIMLNKHLWETSGHWENYRENMYLTKVDDEDYAIKPMNCPGGMLIYKNKPHSYKELPLRIGELGLVHRHELSGVLSGLFRVRSFTQDDAHIFMTHDQIQSEIIAVLELVDEMYSVFGFKYKLELSTRPGKSIGTDKAWEITTKGLKDALDSTGKEYVVNEGDGAFYGPKIDVHLEDALGRTWQCATIQLDMNLPERFDLNYINEKGEKQRPIMIHRVIFGSVERFIGILIEHYAGKFPTWLSPVQIKLISVGQDHIKHCEELASEFKANGIRVEVDSTSESVGKKIRNAIGQKTPYMLVIGDKEVGSDNLHIKTRDSEEITEMSKQDFIEKIKNESQARN